LSRELRRVDGYDDLIAVIRENVATRFGLTNAWLYVREREEETSSSWSRRLARKATPSASSYPSSRAPEIPSSKPYFGTRVP